MSSPNQDSASYEPPKTFTSRLKSLFNFDYFKSLHFVLKILIIIMHVAGAISVSVVYENWGETRYYDFVAVTGIIVIIILILLHFFQITRKFIRVPWNFIELVFDAVWAILILIASAIVTDKAKRYANMDSYAAAAFFGFAALIIYVIDAFLRLIGLIRGKKQMPKSNEAAQPPPTNLQPTL